MTIVSESPLTQSQAVSSSSALKRPVSPDPEHWLLPSPNAQAAIFVEPSDEAQRLLRLMPALVAPSDGRGGPLSWLIQTVVIAPFTQLTFFSFDLQVFLYMVFHQSFIARAGHTVFMAAVNFSLMAGLAQLPVPGGVSLGVVYAAVLAAWYLALARSIGAVLWGAVMLPVLAVMAVGAHLLVAATAPPLWMPWAAALASAGLVALSHAAEARLPPRATQTPRWATVLDFVRGLPGQPRTPGAIAGRAALVGMQVLTGTLNELWASPRLMPYTVLMILFSLGYRPHLYSRLRDRADRAIASGDPAVDYVGIGGGTFLRAPDAP